VVQNLSGKTLDDCTLLTPLGVGRGGTTVWKAARPDGSLAAVKLIEDGSDRAAFEVGIKNATRLRHPQIAVVERWGRTGAGRSYVVSEFVDGEFLESALKRGPVPLHAAVDIGRGVLEALAYAHDEGILHEGIRPSNVAVQGRDQNGRFRIKLVDFGLDALPASIRERGAPERFDARALRYTAPELFVTGKSTPESDLYAVGALLYHLVTGQAPFAGHSPAALKRAHLARQPPSLLEVVPPGPGWAVLDRVCARLMAKQPAQRLSRAADVLRALETVMAAAPQPVYEVDDLDVMEAQSVGTGPQTAVPSNPAPVGGHLEPSLPAFGAQVSHSESQMIDRGVRQTTVLPSPLTTAARPIEDESSVGEKRAILAALVVLVASVGTWLWSGPFEPPKNEVRARGLHLERPIEQPQIKIMPAQAKGKPTPPVTPTLDAATPPSLPAEEAVAVPLGVHPGADDGADVGPSRATPEPTEPVPPSSPPPMATITTVPSGASVSLMDGSSLGHTPWSGVLPDGVQRVRLSRNGFISASVPIKPGQELLSLALRPATPKDTARAEEPSEPPAVDSDRRSPTRGRKTVDPSPPRVEASPRVEPNIKSTPSPRRVVKTTPVRTRPSIATPKPSSAIRPEQPVVRSNANRPASKSAPGHRIGVVNIPDGLMPGEVPGRVDGPASLFVPVDRNAGQKESKVGEETDERKRKPASKKPAKKPVRRIQLLGD